MSFDAASLSILKKKFPATWSRVQAVPKINLEEPPWAYANVHPYGVDPRLIATRWLQTFDLTHNSCNVTSGFGPHLEFILEKMPRDAVLFVLEKSPEWVRSLCAQYDYTKILNDPRLFLVVGEPDDDAFRIFDNCDVAFKDTFTILLYAPVHATDEAYYDRAFAAFIKQLKYFNKLQRTHIEDSAMWQSNTFQNLPHLVHAPDISVARDLFKGLPMVLVSAGPSLDEAIPFLQKAQRKAVIVAVNSAYKALVHNGIVPHLTLAADPRVTTYLGYAGYATDRSFLVCSQFVNKRVVDTFVGRAFTWSSHNQLALLVRKRLGQPVGASILECGTTSACVADLALVLGSHKICLVGQDLAISSTGFNHTRYSFYKDNAMLVSDMEKLVQIPGNAVPTVFADEKLVAYWNTFQNIVKNNPTLQFINTAAAGAKIDGAPYKNHDEALAWLGPDTGQDLFELLTQVMNAYRSTTGTNNTLKNVLGQTQVFAQQLLQLAFEGALEYESLSDKYLNTNYAQHARLKEITTHALTVNSFVEQYREDYGLLFDGYAKYDLCALKRATDQWQDLPPHAQTIMHNKHYFWALVDGSQKLLDAITCCLS